MAIESTNGRLAGKAAIITGAASGIGEAIAQLFAAEGASVLVGDINEDGLAAAAARLRERSPRALAHRLNVLSEDDWKDGVQRAVLEFGRLDVLVNNAGISFSGPIENLSLVDWHRVLAVNLDGILLGMKHAITPMKRSGGNIINVASAAGRKPLPNNAAYGTSKAAVHFLTRVAALEFATYKIRVNSISPGAVATAMWESTDWWSAFVAEKGSREAAMKALVIEKGFAEPVDVARAALFLASDDAKFITGVDLAVDAGWSTG